MEVTSPLPSEVEAVVSNGLVEISVAPGHTLAVIGIEGEEFIRVASDGKVSANASSMTFQMADMTIPSAPSSVPTSGWFHFSDTPVFSYHEHRVHFMASKVSPDIASGGVVATFSLDFVLDGKAHSLKGDLVFDPSLNPSRAKALTSGTDKVQGTTTPFSPFLIAAATALLSLLALGYVLLSRRRPASSSPAPESTPDSSSSSE